MTTSEYTQLLPLNNIKQYCNPFTSYCWQDIPEKVTLQEITDCLAKGEEELVGTESSPWVRPHIDHKEAHIKKISYFVKYGFTEPLSLDVGIPGLCNVNWKVIDGNHRLASAIYKQEVLKEEVFVSITIPSGSTDYAIELGLWKEGYESN